MNETGPGEESSDEAAAWLARLNQRSVSSEELERFYAWRRVPENGAAYARVEGLWRSARGLGDDPEIAGAVREALGRPRRTNAPVRGQGWRPLAVGLVAIVLLLAVTLGTDRGTEYRTATGEQRALRLEDGSALKLNTDSRVHVRFTGREREVHLAGGEAFFDVATDSDRPFVVRAGAARVRAVGTRVAVRLTGPLQVVLVEGAVAVAAEDGGAETALAAGQAYSIGPDGRPYTGPADVEAATSWTSGRLVFRDTPLADALAEANRYSTRKVELRSDRLRSLRVDGTFEAGDVDALVAALTTLFPLRAETGPGGGVVLAPA